MVYVNDKKYACEACINGHRSSSCHHNDRPLFEVKRKGRPVSQCEKCREARQTRRIHGKCICAKGTGADEAALPKPTKRGKRFKPSTPTLPNGLKDVLKPADPAGNGALEVRARVDDLLNPCPCDDVWNCKCASRSTTGPRVGEKRSKAPFDFSDDDGLSTLARAASCCSPVAPTAPPPWKAALLNGAIVTGAQPPVIQYLIEPPGQAHSSSPKQDALTYKTAMESSTSLTSVSNKLPDFSETDLPQSCCAVDLSVADSCCCGDRCECAGCAQHGISDLASVDEPSADIQMQRQHLAKCGPKCSTCIDYDGGNELLWPGQSRATSSFIDQFLARAAAMPPPAKTRSGALDPTNTVVYPRGLFSGGGSEARGLAFGLVNVPKLECCGGRCSCPEGNCECGDVCGGCCAKDASPERQLLPEVSSTRQSPAARASSSKVRL